MLESSTLNLLVTSCARGDLEQVKRIVTENVTLVNRIFMYTTPLASAVANNQAEVVKYLISEPWVNVNLESSVITPLCIAVQNGLADMVKLLIDNPRVDVNKTTHSRRTPLARAIDNMDYVIFKLLLEHDDTDMNKVMTNSYTEPKEETALHVAICTGAEDMAIMIVKNPKTDVLRGGCPEFYPLEMAINRGMRNLAMHIMARYESKPGHMGTFYDYIFSPPERDIFEMFTRNERETRRKLRSELGYPDDEAAQLLVMIRSKMAGKPKKDVRFTKFLRVARRLPLELQMRLCDLAYGKNEDFIKQSMIDDVTKFLGL